MRDPRRLVGADQRNGGPLDSLSEEEWELIRPYLEENERLFGIKVKDLLSADGSADGSGPVRPAGFSESLPFVSAISRSNSAILEVRFRTMFENVALSIRPSTRLLSTWNRKSFCSFTARSRPSIWPCKRSTQLASPACAGGGGASEATGFVGGTSTGGGGGFPGV